MVYLFCNNEYGNAFLRKFIDYSRISNSNKHIIFSSYQRGRPNSPFSRLYGALGSIKRTFVNRFSEFMLTKSYHIKVSFVANVNSARFYSVIQSSDYGIISGFNQIFKENVIERFGSLVNFHPSLLPLYRGPVPSYWCIKNGEKYTGFTLHKVSSKIDQGEILYQGGIIEIGSITDPSILDIRISEFASQVLIEYLDDILGFKQLERRIIKASEFYECNIDYASFPKES